MLKTHPRTRIVFIGNRVPTLERILALEELEVVQVFAERESPLEAWLQASRIKSTLFGHREKTQVLHGLRNLEFDILLANGLPFLLPVSSLRRPGQLFLNVHPSLLPEFRGLHPVNGCLLAGSRYTGATLHYMDDGMDSGNILSQKRFRLTDDIEIGLLYSILVELEADVVETGLKRLIRAKFRFPGRQQAGPASEYRRARKDMRVDFASMASAEIVRRIGAFGSRNRGTLCGIDDKKWKVFSAERIVNPYLLQKYRSRRAGEVVLAYDGRLLIRTTDGIIKVTSMRPDGFGAERRSADTTPAVAIEEKPSSEQAETSMDRPLRLVVISTSRSDFGLLEPLCRGALRDPRFEVRLFVCGQHITAGTPSPQETVGLPVTRVRGSSESIDAISQKALRSALQEFCPDVAVFLGDRYELLSVAETCTTLNLALAHCSGGERTFGSFDDQIRDAITKLSHIHLVCFEDALRRLVSLGEDPWRIAVTGDPGLDSLLAERMLTAEELEPILGTKPAKTDVVVAFYPVTRNPGETLAGIQAIDEFARSFEGQVFLSSSNGDPGSETVMKAWHELAAAYPNCHELPSLGSKVFRSLVSGCGLLVGNTSAGICEAPSLATRSLNLGTRQQGRPHAESVRCCTEFDAALVREEVQILLQAKGQDDRIFANPYGDGLAVPRILNHIARLALRPDLLRKA